MTTQFKSLDGENLRSLRGLATGIYLDGQCYEFAVALHRGLGWQMFGLMEGKTIRHAILESEPLKFWDVRGPLKPTDIGKPFGMVTPSLQRITEKDLHKVRPVFDEAVERASLVAQAMWPDLPWKAGTLQSRALGFIDELEKLCRKHKIWIRAPWPAAQIVLCAAHGDEKGFTVAPTLDGQYFIDRRL